MDDVLLKVCKQS